MIRNLIAVFLFIGWAHGYTLPKAWMGHHRDHDHRIGPSRDVYQVVDNDKVMRFSYPKSEKPVLRDIVYYHVVEKPYDSQIEDKDHMIEGDHEKETETPFPDAHVLPWWQYDDEGAWFDKTLDKIIEEFLSDLEKEQGKPKPDELEIQDQVNPDIPTEEPEMSTAEPEIPEVTPEIPAGGSEITDMEPEIPEKNPELPAVEMEVPAGEPQIPEAEPEIPEKNPEFPEIETVAPAVDTELPENNQELPEVETDMPTANSEIPVVEPEVTETETEVPAVVPEIHEIESEPEPNLPEVVPEFPNVNPEMHVDEPEVLEVNPEMPAEAPSEEPEQPAINLEVQNPEIQAEDLGMHSEEPELSAVEPGIPAENPEFNVNPDMSENPEVPIEPIIPIEAVELPAEEITVQPEISLFTDETRDDGLEESVPLKRRRRSITYPEAPTLAPMNLASLPEYARKLITPESTQKYLNADDKVSTVPVEEASTPKLSIEEQSTTELLTEVTTEFLTEGTTELLTEDTTELLTEDTTELPTEDQSNTELPTDDINTSVTLSEDNNTTKMPAEDTTEVSTEAQSNTESLPENQSTTEAQNQNTLEIIKEEQLNPETTTPAVLIEKNDDSVLEEKPEHKVEEVMATLKPQSLDSDDNNNGQNGLNEHKNARTYGMNLTGDEGYVWNDLVGDPGIAFKVGKPGQHSDNVETSEVPTKNSPPSTESRPNDTENPKPAENAEIDSQDIDDIFVEVHTKRPNLGNDSENYETQQDSTTFNPDTQNPSKVTDESKTEIPEEYTTFNPDIQNPSEVTDQSMPEISEENTTFNPNIQNPSEVTDESKTEILEENTTFNPDSQNPSEVTDESKTVIPEENTTEKNIEIVENNTNKNIMISIISIDGESTTESSTTKKIEIEQGPSDEGLDLTEIKGSTTEATNQISINIDEESTSEKLEHKLEEVMATLKPQILDSDEITDDQNGLSEHKNARTHGMNLTGDEGYVWNDLVGDPGIVFKVGTPGSHSGNMETTEVLTENPFSSTESRPDIENPKPDENAETNSQDIDDILVEVHTIRPNIGHDKGNDESQQDNTTFNPDIQNPSKVTDESMTEIPEEKTTFNPDSQNLSGVTDESKTEIPEENTTFNPDSQNPSGVTDESKTEILEENTTEKNKEIVKNNTEQNVIISIISIVGDKTTESSTEKKIEVEEGSGDKGSDLQEIKESTTEATDQISVNIDKESISNKTTSAIIEITKSELLQELMNNDELWKWVGDWTSKYTELLMKHIKNMIHEEVGRQLKPYVASLEEKLDCNKLKEITKDDNSENDKIVVGGIEIPLTHNTNFYQNDEESNLEEFLKHKKDKDHNKHTAVQPEEAASMNKTPFTVSAQAIFGNSVGSDKVTNLFLFYPHEPEIIDKRPNIDEEKFKPENKEEPTTEIPVLDEKDDSTSSTPNIKDEISTELPKKEENGEPENKESIAGSTEPSNLDDEVKVTGNIEKKLISIDPRQKLLDENIASSTELPENHERPVEDKKE